MNKADEARKRLYLDFEFYAQHALKIRTKAQKVEPLRLNAAQRQLLDVIDRQLEDRGFVRVIVLKGRQMGLSTMIEGWLYWWVSQRKAQKAVVVAHKADATLNLFTMTQRYHKSCPEPLRPSTSYSGRKELVFDKLDSAYTITTAGGDGIGRSDTLTAAHLSELAFWPPSSAASNLNALMEAIPAGMAGTAVFIESTANGVSGVFYDQWQAAVQGQTDFEAVFIPWFVEPEYRRPVPADGFVRTPVEEQLVRDFGLDDEQLMFRRLKIAEKGLDLFHQEYPCTPEEAFLTTGHPVFNPERIAEMQLAATDPLTHMGKEPLARKSLICGEWTDSPFGELACYLPHNPDETYFIGADVGQGVRKDFSVAQVFDSHRRQAAVWRSDVVDPDHFGTVLAALGRFYNEALIICEANNHGILTNRVLTKDENYPHYWTERIVDKVTEQETTRVGFFTSEKSKPLIVDCLRAHIRDREVQIYDWPTLQELRTFVVTQSGRMEADKGNHDDCVIAASLADYVNSGPWTPIENSTNWFLRME